jgi:hypothetical protein
MTTAGVTTFHSIKTKMFNLLKWRLNIQINLGCNSLVEHYATSRKVAGSFPDEALQAHYDSVSAQRLTEMTNRNLPGGKGRPARKDGNVTNICKRIIEKM